MFVCELEARKEEGADNGSGCIYLANILSGREVKKINWLSFHSSASVEWQRRFEAHPETFEHLVLERG